MKDFKKLIKELNDWNNGKGIDIEDWIGCIGDFQKAIGYSTIFWPAFKEVDGCIVNASTPLKNIKNWIKTSPGNPSAIEPTINHLHLIFLHYEDSKNVNAEKLIYLGTILKEIYECKLKRDFPDKKIIVEFNKPDDKDDLEGYELTFYQDKEQNTDGKER